MDAVINIIKSTNPTIIVEGKNMIKGIYGTRQVVVIYKESSDLFDVWAFTLKGVKFSKEEKTAGLFISELKQYIIGVL